MRVGVVGVEEDVTPGDAADSHDANTVGVEVPLHPFHLGATSLELLQRQEAERDVRHAQLAMEAFEAGSELLSEGGHVVAGRVGVEELLKVREKTGNGHEGNLRRRGLRSA